MNQSVIKGKEIFTEINSNLLNSEKEILVVSAWFTDQQLLDTLIKKANEGVSVKVIVANTKDNEKLDFGKLSSAGGNITWVKKKGYGMLHEKYCVIDKKIAFHGSYNWTNNAKRNNSESVIFTDHSETVNQLISDFNTIIEKSDSNNVPNKKLSFLKKIFKNTMKKPQNEKEEQKIIEDLEKISEDQIDKIFNSIIAAEITQTDVETVKKRGHRLAQEVGGDYKTLPNAMNALYHLYISDNNSTNEKKEKLIKKINDKSKEFILKITAEKDQKINSHEIATIAKKNNVESQKNNIIGNKDVLELKNKIISEQKIRNLEEDNENLNKNKSELKISFIKPAFKWHEFIPLSILFIGLSFLMILFYSSSAYIMLYSLDDAIIAISNGIQVNPQVFLADALSLAFDKSRVAGLYILFFVFIPFAIAYISHDKKNTISNVKTKIKSFSLYIIIFLIDTFIAVKVSQTINKIDFLKGVRANTMDGFQTYLTDVNFWLVFFLGAIPFIFVAILMNKLIYFFIERTPEIEELKLKQEISLITNDINQCYEKIKVEKTILQENEIKILEFNNQINELEQKLIYLPNETDKEISTIINETNNKEAIINNKATLYINEIENDTIKISATSLLNRISAFLEGWDEWLHSQFAYQIATTTSQESRDIIDQWLKENVKNLNV